MQFHIETERLILRDLLPSDDRGMYELDSDHDVHRYIGRKPVKTVEESREVIDIIRRQYKTNGIGRWAAIEKSTGAFVGWTGLKLIREPINGRNNHYDLGYRFIKRFWGKGYATETALASVRYAWNVLKADEVFGIADLGNIASRRVLEKVGMLQNGTFEYDGSPHAWYELRRPQFVYEKGALADKAQLQQLAIDSYSEYARVLTPENWSILNSNLRNETRFDALLRNSDIFVCRNGTDIAGAAYLIASGNPTNVFDADWSYIRMVGVHPRYRGHGIAKELTRKCIEHARTSGEKVVALHTSEFMNAARHVYEAQGFRRQREIDAIFGKRYWLYTLNLNEHGSHSGNVPDHI